MKAFSIVCNFDLKDKPVWLDEFREKYDAEIEYHVTLKNTTYLENISENHIRVFSERVVKRYKPFEISFKNIYHHKTTKGECIMVQAEDSDGLDILKKLQSEVRSGLYDSGRHIKPAYLEYEENFDPHLTIARHVGEEDFEKAWNFLESKNLEAKCIAIVDGVTIKFVEAENETEIDGTMKVENIKM
jgi:2'-5' RNA ligase